MQELRRAHYKINADIVLTAGQFAVHLKSKRYDVVLAEYLSPNRQGSRVLEMLNLRERQIPCIFLTDAMQPEIVAKLVTEGASDCVRDGSHWASAGSDSSSPQ